MCGNNEEIEIWDATSIECELEEILENVSDLYVSPTGWVMWTGNTVNTEGDEFLFDFNDGTLAGWTIIDADGPNWINSKLVTGVAGYEDSYCVFSQSYGNSIGSLSPDNYLLTENVYMCSDNYYIDVDNVSLVNIGKGERMLQGYKVMLDNVTSVLGQVVMDKAVDGDKEIVDMSQMESGVYMVQIVSESGVTVKRVNVIK